MIETYKSPVEMLCLANIGFCSLMISSTPKLAWKFVSISSKRAMEPSAPPPLEIRINILLLHCEEC